jgi:hypothetical protein
VCETRNPKPMSLYAFKPERFLERLHSVADAAPPGEVFCAGFEMEEWRCAPLACHLVEWLPDYALAEHELHTHHGNAFVRLREAAVRVYTSPKYERRGEAGEITLHAICRDYFETVPISPRVFYKSTSNDVVKSFDMVHARFPESGKLELWLGESKLFQNPTKAVAAAISSIQEHIDRGFLTNQKLILGPQIPKETPHYEQIIQLFKPGASLDKLISAAVFPVGIFCTSGAAQTAKECSDEYRAAALKELEDISNRLRRSGLCTKLKLLMIYVPLATKEKLVKEFDRRLKGLQ